MFDIILVRYGEIGLKSERVRRRFEEKLVRNIAFGFEKENLHAEIKRERGRILLRSPDMEKAKEILKRIFGVVSISPAVETHADIESIKRKSLELVEKKIKDIKTFAVSVTRTGKHDFTSQDVAVEAGREIKERMKLEVNLENPDLRIYIEIRGEKAYLFFEKIRGPAGLPTGTQGKILSLVRNKKDLLALWFMLKRGCSARIISYGMDKQIERFLERWYVENEVEISEDDNIEKNTHRCLAIVVGETMHDIKFDLDWSYDLPVMRPLISFSEEEISSLLEEIGV